MLSVFFAFAAAPAVPQAPTSKWLVDFADAQCVASRDYGEEKLFLKASPMGDVVQLGIMRPGPSLGAREVDVRLEPAGAAAFKGSAIAWSSGKPARRLYMVNLPVEEFRRISASPSLKVRFGDIERHFGISGMAALAGVMKSCVDDLQTVWVDGEDDGPKAMANLASYFTSDDYPEDAVRAEESGTTRFALLVNEAGRVADCMVIQTSRQATLDTQTCAILTARARFTPGKTKDGKPRKGRAVGQIRWVIP